MKKNTLLSIAIVICKFIRVLYVLTFLILTSLFIYLQINPVSIENNDLDYVSNNKIFLLTTPLTNSINNLLKENPNWVSKTETKISYSSKFTYGDEKKMEDSEVFVIDKLTKVSLYFCFIQYILFLYLSFLCVKEFQRVIESVKELKTFQDTNVLSFRKIGKYLLTMLLLTSYSYYGFERGVISEVSFSSTLLILSLLAYIMAEIFKEGNNLEEENKLTV